MDLNDLEKKGEMKLDILVIAAHPDDGEIGCAGSILKYKASGKKIGMVDLTEGELGSRGSASLRFEESAKASELMGLDVRVNLGLKDGFFQNDEASQKKLIEQIRRFKPDVVLCNAFSDRHPDHGKGSKLASDACFLSGLVKIETLWEGETQEKWRPKAVYHYVQDRYLKPDFVVDISDFIDQKIQVLMAYSSQFYNPESNQPETPISSKDFFDFLKGRWADFGRQMGVEYAEGFQVERPIGVDDITTLL